MNTIHHLATSAVLAGLGGMAVAAPTIYENRNAFDLAAGPQFIETFESTPPGDLTLPTAFASGLQVSRPVGTVDVYVGSADVYDFTNTTNPGRHYLAFGRDNAVGGPQTGSYTAQFAFQNATDAFGFDISGFEPLLGAQGFSVTTFLNGQIAEDFFVPAAGYFPVRFFGFVSDAAFDTVRLNIPVIGFEGHADYVAFDDVVWAVPAPGGAAVLALAGLAAARRRR